MKFIPKAGHILIFPEEINDAAKIVKRDDGTEIRILHHDRTKELAMKAVNKGAVVATSSIDPDYSVGKTLVYYPYCPNKIVIDEKEYHVIHERDVMGYVKPSEVA